MKESSDSVASRWRWLLAVGFTAFLTVLPVNFLGGFFQGLELAIYDRWLIFRPQVTRDSQVTLITITDADLLRLQHSSVPDGVLAGVLNGLIAHRPRAIGLDLYRDIPLPPGTEALRETLNGHGEIVIARQYGDAALAEIAAPAYLRNPGQAACTDLVQDDDGRVRRVLLYLGDGESLCYGIGYALALRFLEREGIVPKGEPGHPEILRLGDTPLPPLESYDGGYLRIDSGGYQFLLDYRNPPAAFRRYSFEEARNGLIDPAHIAGRILLIGTKARSNKDLFSIPHQAHGDFARNLAGFELHGIIADQLVRAALHGDHPSRTLPEWVEILWTLSWCLAGTAIGSRNWPLWFFGPLQAVGLAVGGASAYGLFLSGFWMPLIPSALGWLFATTFAAAWTAHRESRQRQTLMNLFGRHVDPRIAEEIWRHRDQILNGGKIAPKRMMMTVFFSDLTGFTALAERLEPEVFIDWLNEYLDIMTRVINRHGGVVVRFVGDAILAGFGIPLPRISGEEISKGADNAVQCALSIQEQLVALNKSWESRGLPQAGMRIGINTGPLLAGSLGNRDRLEYTLHGDTVNTAARLESFEKELFQPDLMVAPCRILLSDGTARLLPERFRLESLGPMQFKGKSMPTGVYRLLARL